MKRFFTNLKAMATKMLAVALVGVAAVACAEAYDDTDLRAQVADLAQRVSDLEERMDEEVAALRALIDQKVALAEVAADGAWKFTLSDGKTLTLYPEYVENGLTVVTEGGVQYWAKVEGNVTTILKDANGNNVAVHSAPELRVSAEGMIEVSVDGGATWVATQAPSLFAAIDVKDNHACLTLQNGEVLKFALYEQVSFNVNGNTLFVGSEESEMVTISAEGIVEIIPIVVPEGWDVSVKGNVMTVTAPYADPDMGDGGMGMMPMPGGSAEEEPTPAIKVLAVSKEGKTMVATLYVVVSGNGGQSLKVVGGDLVITNNMQTYDSWWDEWSATPIAYTAFPAGEFTLDSFITAKQNYDYPYEILYMEENGTLKMSVAEALEAICGVEEIKRGDAYTFIAFDANSYAPAVTEIMSATYVATYTDVQISNLTFKDAQLDIVVEGYDGYKVVIYDTTWGMSAKEEFNDWKKYASMGMTWGVDMTENYSGSAFAINTEILPYANRLYSVYVLPLSALKSTTDYVWEDVLGPFAIKTKNYSAGGMLQPTIGEPEADYQNFNAQIAPAEGAYRTHAWYFTATEMAELTDEGLVAKIVDNGYISAGDDIYLSNEDALNPGTTLTIAAISVDQNGKYGPIVKKTFSTQALQYSTATIEIIDWNLKTPTRTMTINDSYYTFGVKVTGELAKTYMCLIEWNQYMDVEKEASKIAVNLLNNSVSKYIPLTDVATNDEGKYAPVGKSGSSWSPKYMGIEYGKEYCLAIFGVDAEGKPAQVACKQFDTFVPMTIVYAEDARWTASKPTITVGEPVVLQTMYESLKESWDGYLNMLINEWGYSEQEAKDYLDMMVDAGELQDPEKMTAEEKAAPASLDVPFTVTPGAGAVKCLVEYNSDGNFNEVATRVWIDNMAAVAEAAPADGKVSQHLVYEITGETTLTAQSVFGHVTNWVYVTWQDADGNWYETVETIMHKGLYDE